MPPRQSCWEIYNTEMSQLNHGHALWEPAPLSYYRRIQPGDVGYIRTGCFHLLFSAGCPLGDRQLGVDVPSTFKQLDVGPIINRQPRAPGYLSTDNVRASRQVRLKPLNSPPSTSMPSMSTPSTSTLLTSSPSTPPFPMLASASTISFRLTGGQGAALVSRYRTYREDIQRAGTFEKYVKEHHASWVAFARETGHGSGINPVLVTGVDRTRDFAMMSYSSNNDDLRSEFTTSVSGVDSASPWGTWQTMGFVFTNCGPQLCCPPSSTQITESTLDGDNNTETGSDWYNQSVFVRYYTVRKRLGIPKVIKAGAGPHDLGPGSRRDGNNGEGEKSSTTDVGSESDTIVHNTTPDGEDDFDAIAKYVFQNTDAEFVLLHHRDVALLREPGGNADLSTQLYHKRPLITVDENGVAMIWGQTTTKHKGTNHSPSSRTRVRSLPSLHIPIIPSAEDEVGLPPFGSPNARPPTARKSASLPNLRLSQILHPVIAQNPPGGSTLPIRSASGRNPNPPPVAPYIGPRPLTRSNPAWASAQYQTTNAFPQGYPPGTPFHTAQQDFTPYQRPGSLQPPSVGLPLRVPPSPTLNLRFLPEDPPTDWTGPTSGWDPTLPQVTPYNGPQPYSPFNSFQQFLPGGGPPSGFDSVGWVGDPYPAGYTSPWSGPLPLAGWGGWGGGPQMAAQSATPLTEGDGGITDAMRDGSNGGLDIVDRFATGPHYGPVLSPLILRIVGAQLRVNPLLSPPTQDLDHVYLRWNMLFGAFSCIRSNDRPTKLWSTGRASPATHPRLTEVKIISRTFPWVIAVHAADPNIGVTCGEIINKLGAFLHSELSEEDAELDSGSHKVERDQAYRHNRSTAIGVPGGRLGDELLRLDWLCKDTMFGGLEVDNLHAREFFGGAPPPGIITLICMKSYPLTEQEQNAREREEDDRIRAAQERAREAESRAAELEEKGWRQFRGARSRSRAGGVHGSTRSRIPARNPSTDEGSDD